MAGQLAGVRLQALPAAALPAPASDVLSANMRPTSPVPSVRARPLRLLKLSPRSDRLKFTKTAPGCLALAHRPPVRQTTDYIFP